MDISSSLLLLLCMAASKVPITRARPVDFVCSDHARMEMNKAKDLEAAMSECRGSNPLPSLVPLPCVKIHKASWEKKTLQKKRDEVQAALRMLSEGVRVVRTHSQPGCPAVLLDQLEHSVTNHLLIVAHLPLGGEGTQGEYHHADTSCQLRHTQDLGHILEHYNRLLRGKLEWLMGDLSAWCHKES
uniref:Thrombopoietin n=1 Tax=Paramormyrops kingsleyae TaxID=1676925 RepID=A0A3B3SVC9_9TELE